MRMDWREYIHVDFNILMGKPVFRGTRVPVDLILGKMATGEIIEQTLEAYPRLTREAILAALAFAAATLRADAICPVLTPHEIRRRREQDSPNMVRHGTHSPSILIGL